MAAVSLRKVSKSYGGVPVIRAVDLDIPDHAFAVLVGPSGCGKSTLLKLIAGLDELTTGEVSIGGRVVNDRSPAARDIAMVFQSYALYPHMTVADNLGFHLKIVGMPKAERDRRIAKVAENLGIAQFLDRFPRDLSGGQRQRVAMGRAIVREPQVFLFDEPLSNLDAKLRIQVRAEIKALQQRLRTTAIYVTHDQVEAMTLADFIVVMRDGAIEQVGAPLDVYDNPANAFVGGFIGSPPMNLIEGILHSGSTGAFVDASGLRLPLDRAMNNADGRKVIYGIRPGAFAPDKTDGSIRAEVEVIEPTGDELFAHVMAGPIRLHVAFAGRPAMKVGETVYLRPKPDRIHLFDAQDGVRIKEG